MKRLLAVTNFLLAVIAICLCLIVTKLYDFSVVTPAHAHDTAQTSPMPVRIVNERVQCTVEGTVDARMHLNDVGWSPVKGHYGVMLVKRDE